MKISKVDLVIYSGWILVVISFFCAFIAVWTKGEFSHNMWGTVGVFVIPAMILFLIGYIMKIEWDD